MNAVVSTLSPHTGGAFVPARDMDAVRHAMKTSLYPGASDESVDMVLAYCKARNLDVMTKPVHLVPMWVPERRQGNQVISPAGMRDVVMPGIGTYRIDAHRTGEYAGQDEAEFGPAVTHTFHDGNRKIEVTFPAWCKATVYRLMHGVRIAYAAKVFWLETYATAGRDTDAPNAMWRKRPNGQLEKCAEALALRKGFPEAVGSAPTAEEMEGKGYIDAEVVTVEPRTPESVVAMPRAKSPAITVTTDAPAAIDTPPAVGAASADDEAGGLLVSESQKRMLLTKAKQAGFFTEEDLLKTFPRIDAANINAVLVELRKIQDRNDGA